MRYFGVFNVMDGERKNPPSVVVVTDDEGTVTGYTGGDAYLLLAKALAEKANIRDVAYGPSQFVLDEIDAPVSSEVSAYLEDVTNDEGLRHLVGGLAREEPFLDGGTNWVAFLADDAYIDASVKLGTDSPRVLSIDAYLLRTDSTMSNEQEVQAWVDRQPKPMLGMLSVGSRERDNGEVEFLPLLAVDCHLDSILAEFIRDLISPFAETWDTGAVAVSPSKDLGGGDGDGGVYRYRPAEITPRNAWLLIGDEASYPTPDDLHEQRERAEAGIFDYDWTAPKNGELGDLVLVHFVAPLKAACFVARLATRPFWQADVEVNAVNTVDLHQWWAQLTPLVEIEPIPYKTLREAAGGYLPLRGRSGHYLSPQTIGALTFTAKDAERQAEVDRVVQTPVGDPKLPEKGQITFELWKQIPNGLLPLEAKVSEYVVEPLAAILAENPLTRLPNPYRLEREHRVPGGFVDFVFRWGDLPPVAAVEVKLAILRPESGVWTESPDFRQLRRYMDYLEAPGLLIDARSVLLVRPGEGAPYAEIVRSEATWKEVVLICDLLGEGFDLKKTQNGPPGTHPDRVARRGKPLKPLRSEGIALSSELDSRVGQVQVREDFQWVSEYDYPRRVASLTLCNGREMAGHHWSGIALDESLSDPDGRFQVFVARRADGESRIRPDDDSQLIVKIVAALDDDGGLLAPHPSFDPAFIGSYTIWPYKHAGERFGLRHWLWWREGWPFDGEPRSWREAAEAAVD